MQPGGEYAAGALIGEKYRVKRTLGRGGMGVVYEAEHVLSGRRVAVKLLLASMALHPLAIARFMREGRAAASIGDSHIVEVLDMGQLPGGDLYVALEFLDGKELSVAIERERPLPIGRIAHIGMQLAAAMGKAHALGIVHRDLKPANVFLVERDGDPDYVKVLDFGIAKLEDPPTEDGSSAPLTRTGQIIGTPLYMSSEQLRGAREVDARADVYAIGVILYEMVCGTLPFQAETMPEMFLQIMTSVPPPISSHRNGVPPEFVAIVEKAMAREAAARFATGADLAAALRPFAKEWDPRARLADSLDSTIQSDMVLPAIPARPTTQAAVSFDSGAAARRSPPRSSWIAGGVAMALIGALGVGVFLSRHEPPNPNVAATRSARPEPIVTNPAPVTAIIATPPAPTRVPLRFVGAAGVTVSIEGVMPCISPCTLELDQSTAPTVVSFATPEGEHWSTTTARDAPHEITIVSPVPVARPHHAATTTARHAAHAPATPPSTVSPQRPEAHIELDQ